MLEELFNILYKYIYIYIYIAFYKNKRTPNVLTDG